MQDILNYLVAGDFILNRITRSRLPGKLTCSASSSSSHHLSINSAHIHLHYSRK